MRVGFVLVEVMVAVFMAAFLVGPLATSMQSSLTIARSLRSDAAGLSAMDGSRDQVAAWTWGIAIEEAIWELGPELTVKTAGSGGSDLVVGAWADGWSLGQWAVEGGTGVKLPIPVWNGLAGKELVVRVREAEGPWGPPWRSAIPDLWGAVPLDTATEAADDPSALDLPGEPGVIVHVPWFSTPQLEASWTMTPVSNSILGLSFALVASSRGLCEVSLGEQRQSWLAEEGRQLDVFF